MLGTLDGSGNRAKALWHGTARHGNENGSCQGRPGHAETPGLRCRVGRGEIVAVAQGSPLSGIDSTRGEQVVALQPK